MKPTISHEVDGAINKATSEAGALASIIKPQLAKFKSQIVDGAVKSVVTAQGLAKVFKAGGDVTGPIKDIVMGQVGKLGGGLSSLTGGGGSGSSGGGLGGLLGGLTGGQKGGLGGLLGGLAGKKAKDALGGMLSGKSKKAEANSDEPAEKASYGLGNLKRFASTSPTRMVVGVAKNAKTDGADVTAVMEFKNFDWKLTNIIPRKR